MSRSVQELHDTAREILANGRGILAADESNSTMTKRLEGVGIESTEETRLKFRELMVSADGAEQWIGGVILYDETIRQSASDGTSIPQFLTSRGIAPGIKVDTGAKPLALSPGEKVTEGLDGLRERLEEYVEMGARFAKWRGVIQIGDGLPTDRCLKANAHALARYAALCQEAGLVPIVEPETMMDGDHPIDRSEDATRRTLHHVFRELFEQQVAPEGMLLKVNMVMAGYDSPEQADVEEVAKRTLHTLRQVVPAAVPGVVFLSGGQDDQRSSAHLNAMSQAGDLPWDISFSYARALQGLPMEIWHGEDANVEAAQEAFQHRARLTAAARRGEYSQDMEQERGQLAGVGS